MSTTNMSLPPSSPRLPSPPPPAEIQICPKSPATGPNAARQGQLMEQTAIDANAKRRIHPGTKSADMAAGPPLVPLHELDSAFQLQEHLAALHYHHTQSNTSAITRETARTLASPPQGIDKTLWLYELCRFLVGQCNSLIVGFLFDAPPCSAATCPEMRASEWQFLCAVHDAPKSCCAIDYCCHTLDWAANVVTNPKIFPSRFVVDAHDKNTALKNLVNVFRRLHRIFAHAWFQHRGVFWSVEGQTGLYVFFKTVCDIYDLLPAENYKLPPEAEGLEAIETDSVVEKKIILQHHSQQQPGSRQVAQRGPPELSDDDSQAPVGRTNTRRHIKSSPSTGSAVTTVPEADEDESAADVTSRLRNMHISTTGAGAAASLGDELEIASIPVIVEHQPMEQPIRPSSVVPISGPGSIAAMRAFEAASIPELERQNIAEGEPEMEVEVKLEAQRQPESAVEAEGFRPNATSEPLGPTEPSPDVSAKRPEPISEHKSAVSALAVSDEEKSEIPGTGSPDPETSLGTGRQEAEVESSATTSAAATAATADAVEGKLVAGVETASDGASINVPTPPASDGEPVAEEADGADGEIAVAIAPDAEETGEGKTEAKADGIAAGISDEKTDETKLETRQE